MRKGNIRVSCGTGDFLTYLSRIADFKKQTGVDYVHIQIAGGWKEIPLSMLRMGEVCVDQGLISSVTYSALQNADISEDWQPDQNPLKYKMTLPFVMPSVSKYSYKDSYPDRKICVIHPVTYEGSFEGINTPRYLPANDWNKVCQHLRSKKYMIVCVGAMSERDYVDKSLVDWNLCGLSSIDETISVLKTADLVIGTSSWCWECAAYACVPTVCLYYAGEYWLNLHTPSSVAPCFGINNLRVDVTKDINSIIRYIDELGV